MTRLQNSLPESGNCSKTAVKIVLAVIFQFMLYDLSSGGLILKPWLALS